MGWEEEEGRRCAVSGGGEVWRFREVEQARVKGRLVRRVRAKGGKRWKVEENRVADEMVQLIARRRGYLGK